MATERTADEATPMRKMLSMKMLSMLLAPALAGCGMFSDDGTFRDRSRDYLSAREYPVIRVPEGLDDEALTWGMA
jgi:uncharacterized lipoprotein